MSENTVKHEHKQCGGKNIEKMEEIGKTMPVEEEIYDVAELFKVLGDQTRVHMTRYYLCMTATSLQMKQILTCLNNMGYVLEKMEQV